MSRMIVEERHHPATVEESHKFINAFIERLKGYYRQGWLVAVWPKSEMDDATATLTLACLLDDTEGLKPILEEEAGKETGAGVE
jgi:hypothetical protein